MNGRGRPAGSLIRSVHVIRDLIEHVDRDRLYIPISRLAHIRDLVSSDEWDRAVSASGLVRVGRTSIYVRRCVPYDSVTFSTL